ncbi:hypothetical protein LCGC14_2128080, partial [marine sediment metagenome]
MKRQCVLGVTVLLASAVGQALAADAAKAKLLPLTVRLELESAKALKIEDIKYSVFPGGRRCAFTYKGARKPATIAAFTEMGFRTTVHTSPRTAPATVKAIEAAGAEIAVSGYWGAKGTYGSMIGGNTVQEAFDAVTTSRMVLAKLCKGPVACAGIGGHFDHETWPFSRSVESGSGYGGVLHDSHFLLTNRITSDSPFAIQLGRGRAPRVAMRERFSNVFGQPRKVPNEKVYYQMLAHQFLGTLDRLETGQIVMYSMRDFKPKDLRSIKRVMGKYGRHPLIWHATEGMIAGYEYLKRKVQVLAVKPAGAGAL